MALFYSFADLLMSASIEVSWIFISASALELFQYFVLVERYEANLASHVTRKEKSILIPFSDECRYSLILC